MELQNITDAAIAIATVATVVSPEAATVVGVTGAAIDIIFFAKDIPTILFTKKLSRFLNGVVEIPVDRRQKYADKFQKYAHTDMERILNTINSTEDEEKCRLYANAFRLLIDERIDRAQFFRLVHAINAVIMEDIEYLRKQNDDPNCEWSPSMLSLNAVSLVNALKFSVDEKSGHLLQSAETTELGKLCIEVYRK